MSKVLFIDCDSHMHLAVRYLKKFESDYAEEGRTRYNTASWEVVGKFHINVWGGAGKQITVKIFDLNGE